MTNKEIIKDLLLQIEQDLRHMENLQNSIDAKHERIRELGGINDEIIAEILQENT